MTDNSASESRIWHEQHWQVLGSGKCIPSTKFLGFSAEKVYVAFHQNEVSTFSPFLQLVQRPTRWITTNSHLVASERQRQTQMSCAGRSAQTQVLAWDTILTKMLISELNSFNCDTVLCWLQLRKVSRCYSTVMITASSITAKWAFFFQMLPAQWRKQQLARKQKGRNQRWPLRENPLRRHWPTWKMPCEFRCSRKRALQSSDDRFCPVAFQAQPTQCYRSDPWQAGRRCI